MGRIMKESEIKWLEEIPENWSLIRVKNKYTHNKEIVGNRVEEFERLSLTLNGVLKRPKDDNEGLQPEKFEGYQILRNDQLVFKLIDLENVRTSRVGLSQYTGIVSPAYIILDNREESRFGYYYFLSMWQREVFNKLGGDGVRSSLSAKDLLNIPYINVPKEEQIKIVNYLDNKVYKIDEIINKTKKTIEEYNKYKQSIITECTTTGLNKDVVMKDSNIEWNRYIPSHWQVINPRWLFVQRKDKAFEEDEQLTASQKHGIIYQKDFMLLENQKVVLVEKDFSILKHVEPNDFVISMRSFQGGLEYSKLRGCISSAYVMLIPNDKVYSPYFRWLFKSEKYINALQSTSNLVRDGQALRYSNFVQIPLFIFSKEEQKEIADYLDKKCEEIDRIIHKKEKLIIELENYKKSLIYECVTGKKEI